jgi:hypothetical protein
MARILLQRSVEGNFFVRVSIEIPSMITTDRTTFPIEVKAKTMEKNDRRGKDCSDDVLLLTGGPLSLKNKDKENLYL